MYSGDLFLLLKEQQWLSVISGFRIGALGMQGGSDNLYVHGFLQKVLCRRPSLCSCRMRFETT